MLRLLHVIQKYLFTIKNANIFLIVQTEIFGWNIKDTLIEEKQPVKTPPGAFLRLYKIGNIFASIK